MLCLNCGIKTKNPKYCSRSCGAILNGKLFPKRKKTKTCKNCDNTINSHLKFCKNCRQSLKRVTPETTLKDVTYAGNGNCNNFSYVRHLARQKAKSLGWSSCSKCGYDKHFEIAHIKALADFDELTLLSTINDTSNLLALCPNCHWEFDNLKVAESGIAPEA